MTRRSRPMRQERRKPEHGPSAPLFVEFRPMRIADMVPGYEYDPGMMLFRAQTPPLNGRDGSYSLVFEMPVWLPPEYREQSTFNIQVALAIIEAGDPDAARQIERLKAAARTPEARRYAAAHPLFRDAIQGGGHVDQA